MADTQWVKDPDAVLDWVFDWKAETNQGKASVGDWLDGDVGEIITSYTVTVDAGLTKDSDSRVYTNTAVQVWLSGGTAGQDYDVTCSIETSEGRKDDRTITIRVRER